MQRSHTRNTLEGSAPNLRRPLCICQRGHQPGVSPLHTPEPIAAIRQHPAQRIFVPLACRTSWLACMVAHAGACTCRNATRAQGIWAKSSSSRSTIERVGGQARARPGGRTAPPALAGHPSGLASRPRAHGDSASAAPPQRSSPRAAPPVRGTDAPSGRRLSMPV